MGDFFVDIGPKELEKLQKVFSRTMTLYSDTSKESLVVSEKLRKLDIPFFLASHDSGKLMLRVKDSPLIEGYEAISQYLDQFDK